MDVQEFYQLVDACEKAYSQYSLYQCFSECFEQWFSMVNADNDQDVNQQIVKFIAAENTLRLRHNALDEKARRELHELEVGVYRYPLFDTMHNLATNLNHEMRLEGTTRKTIAERLELIGLPYKPVELDLVRRDLLKLKKQIEGPRNIAAAVADVLQHFINQPAREVFERSEKWATYVKVLEQIKPIDGIGSQSYMDVGDTSISIELGALIDDIVSWSQEVSEQRSDYLFNNMVTELPDPYWMAFGLTSDVVKRYESLTGRMKRLIECLKQVSPRGAKIPELAQVHHSLEKSFNEKERTAPISKQEIIRLIGCGETKFRRIKKEGMYGLQDVPKTRDVTLWKEDYERLKNK